MATSYTTNLGLALPVTGELQGSWGDVVNQEITELLDNAIAGTTTLSSDADVTLTDTDGAANQSRQAILLWTANGTLTRTITAPARTKAYIVINATGGTQSIKLVGAGPTTGITIVAGERCLAAWNGSDFVKVASTVLQSTVTVAQGGTGQTSLTAENVILGNGTSAVKFVAPGTSGNVLTSNGTTWASTALPPGGLTYVYKTGNYTATDKQGVLADTSGGAFTVTLPSGPATGAQVVVADAGAAWGTNNLTVGRNGSTIGGLAEDLTCDISGAAVTLIYDGTTWEVYAQIGGNGGTAVTLTGVQTLTNKTISADDNTLSGIAASSFVLSNASGNIDGSAAQKAIPTGVVVGTTDSQTLTNKTIEAGTFTNGYTEETATANTGTGYTIDLANGTVQILTLTGNCTFTFPAVTAGRSFMLLLKQDATGSRTVTWPATVKWPGGTAPTITATASKLDKYVFTADGTNWYGSNAGQNYTV